MKVGEKDYAGVASKLLELLRTSPSAFRRADQLLVAWVQDQLRVGLLVHHLARSALRMREGHCENLTMNPLHKRGSAGRTWRTSASTTEKMDGAP